MEDRLPANAARLGEYAIARLTEIGSSCPFVFEVRGKGMMFGVDFRRPESSLKLKAAWDALHLLNEGVFSQTVIVPLMHEHRILAQVAGYHTELIKFLPPLNIGDEALEYFLAAMGRVLGGLQRVPGSAWETVRTLARGGQAALAASLAASVSKR